MADILVIDNYDSFTYNLVHILRGLGASLRVVRNNAFALEEVEQYDRLVLSPGPGIPREAGLMPEVIRRYGATKDILGVCLGHQALGEAFGARLHNLAQVHHGVATTCIATKEDLLFKGLPPQFEVGRYHSWAVLADSCLPDSGLEITAVDEEGAVMALRHRQHRIRGVQFHPESILTPHGTQMLQNWLRFSSE
ncbi:anthranilate synthase component II [Cesiribacter andamanensis]|uniref:Para-aminobenzoate synthase glutamine amidotransferase component II n=1 Tax=Cesiribacter andamanensis AMV16 TaxID=1279009 RepID=M7N356_9BACT|nr:aminodeoxychorismate/anthranilate synthase component II [Cesiribacter andamanensis]EMR01656.1 Para-aminobenzoate synthase glutamine amidotransferase component II [Cesiribacter andamanensis AMV16]